MSSFDKNLTLKSIFVFLYRPQQTSTFRTVVMHFTDLNVPAKLPPEAEIEAMVKQVRDGIGALNLDVSFIDQNNITLFASGR